MADIDWDIVVPSVGLLSLATVSIYCGAFASLTSPRERKAQKRSFDDDDDDELELLDSPHHLSSGDAWLLPIIGSVTLFGMYLLVVYLGEEWMNWLFGWYFTVAGALSGWQATVSLAKSVIGRERWTSFDPNHFIILKHRFQVVWVSFRTPTLVLFPVGILPSILYRLSWGSHRSALLTDILALSFSHNTLSILKLDSFRTGCILLAGLFFYDIYWVFGTNVMVKVATSLDVPIKLLWPKSMTFATERGFTMLGLGDVVIPGLFISLALRYDHARAEKKQTPFAKPYFVVTLTAYVVGLIATMTALHVSGRGQPALLYLSPACILSLVGTAFVRGELEDVWGWSDDPKLSAKKIVQEASVASRALPRVENGNGTPPQPNASADGGHTEAEATEGDEEEGASEQEQGKDEVKAKKRKNKGRRKV